MKGVRRTVVASDCFSVDEDVGDCRAARQFLEGLLNLWWL
jgi:hypothetical protein